MWLVRRKNENCDFVDEYAETGCHFMHGEVNKGNIAGSEEDPGDPNAPAPASA